MQTLDYPWFPWRMKERKKKKPAQAGGCEIVSFFKVYYAFLSVFIGNVGDLSLFLFCYFHIICYSSLFLFILISYSFYLFGQIHTTLTYSSKLFISQVFFVVLPALKKGAVSISLDISRLYNSLKRPLNITGNGSLTETWKKKIKQKISSNSQRKLCHQYGEDSYSDLTNVGQFLNQTGYFYFEKNLNKKGRIFFE